MRTFARHQSVRPAVCPLAPIGVSRFVISSIHTLTIYKLIRFQKIQKHKPRNKQMGKNRDIKNGHHLMAVHCHHESDAMNSIQMMNHNKP